jgi:FkbM family methyltransferase
MDGLGRRLAERVPAGLRPLVWDGLLRYRAARRRLVGARRDPDAGAGDAPVDRVVETGGVRLHLDRSLSPLVRWRIAADRHTRSERRLIAEAIEPDDVVMELGGGIGLVAIFCAQRIGAERVHSYEANPALEPLIRRNYALNGVAPNINFCMLGREAGETTFFVAASFQNSSSLATEAGMRPVTVPVRPLNAELARIRPTFLVIDIEGGEIELLAYADLTGVRKIMLEVHTALLGAGPVNALRRRLRRQGFAETSYDGQCYLYRRPAGRA